LCLSKDPWAVNPSVRTGIHAVLRLDCAKEELIQLKNELRRCVSWGIHFHKQLKNRIDQCVFGGWFLFIFLWLNPSGAK
jgi:hypothetical protein